MHTLSGLLQTFLLQLQLCSMLNLNTLSFFPFSRKNANLDHNIVCNFQIIILHNHLPQSNYVVYYKRLNTKYDTYQIQFTKCERNME